MMKKSKILIAGNLYKNFSACQLGKRLNDEPEEAFIYLDPTEIMLVLKIKNQKMDCMGDICSVDLIALTSSGKFGRFFSEYVDKLSPLEAFQREL